LDNFFSVNSNSQTSPVQTAKRAVEKQLMESTMKYTIIQPTVFMEIWLSPFVGFDYPNSKATIYGDGINKLSWISLKDVAAFAVICVDNPSAMNSVLELGGPGALAPLEVVKIFEQHSGINFTVEHIPIEALHAQKNTAADSLSESFAAILIGYAEGGIIDMEDTVTTYPVKLTSVADYVKQVIPK
jgi:uncharacterized protein YbjT (DUF2867 family)